MAHQQFCFQLLTFLHAICYAVMFHYTNDLNRREREYIPAVVKTVCLLHWNMFAAAMLLYWVMSQPVGICIPIPLFNKIVSHYPVSAIWCGIIAVLRKKLKSNQSFYKGLESHAN